MRTKEELEKITCQISKDLCKYELTFPELTVILSWYLGTIAQRIHFKTHEWKPLSEELKDT
jgi:hypothetical protein